MCTPPDLWSYYAFCEKVNLEISDEFNALANLVDDGQGVELYYDIAMSESFRLAVDFQVIDPTFTGADTAVVPGIRAHIEF